MSAFSGDVFIKKLADLTNTAPSIQTLSLWLIHHRKHAKTIVKIWKKEVIKASASRKKLTLMYLANDVIQNSKKKGSEFNQGFAPELAEVYRHLGSSQLDDKTERGVKRLLDVWLERGVFNEPQINSYRAALAETNSPVPIPTMSPDGLFKEPLPKKKRVGVERAAAAGDDAADGDGDGDPDVEEPEERRRSSGERRKPDIREVEVEGHKEVHTTLSPHSPAREPPEPAELIRALQDLESSASADATTREKISSLPPEVSDTALLSRLQDRVSGQRLMEQVSEALDMLTDYNSRLAGEMDERKRISRLLQDFTQSQKDLLAQAEKTLDEYRLKLEKVYLVREELKSHIQNLPDISKLPNVTGGFAPLPSAGDLFS